MNFYIMCKFIYFYNLELKYFIFHILSKICVPYLSCLEFLSKSHLSVVQCKVSKGSSYKSHFLSLVTAVFFVF